MCTNNLLFSEFVGRATIHIKATQNHSACDISDAAKSVSCHPSPPPIVRMATPVDFHSQTSLVYFDRTNRPIDFDIYDTSAPVEQENPFVQRDNTTTRVFADITNLPGQDGEDDDKDDEEDDANNSASSSKGINFISSSLEFTVNSSKWKCPCKHR